MFDMTATDKEAAALAERENAYATVDLIYILSHCYHVGNQPYSLTAARNVQHTLSRRLGLKDRGVRRAPFYVLAGTRMPAILVELGFLSNRYDRKKLQSKAFRKEVAEALFDAIKQFDRGTRKIPAKAGLSG